MTEAKPNSAIWDAVCVTDPKYTKQFNRSGFKGTATNVTWLAREATKMFGPCGIGWGTRVLDERYQPGKEGDVVHIIRLQLWYIWQGQRGEIEQYGQTTFVGTYSTGPFTDEEAPKKSMSDAMSKCLSLLGFASDIHMGRYDDNKYVASLARGGSDAATEPDAQLSRSLKDTAYGPEEHARSDAQAQLKVDAKVEADALVASFTALTSGMDGSVWIEENAGAWDVMEKTQRARVYRQCLQHVKKGMLDGMTEAGFSEELEHMVKRTREKAVNGNG